jgi:tetratricopeptide (TPR) repeat protein
LVLGLVVCGGGGWLWVKAERDERARKLATEVQETLDRCQAARERANVAGLGDFADWSEARGAAERARALLGDTGAGDQELRSRVDDVLNEIREEERDRRLLADLDAARLAAAESYDPVRKTFAHERTVALYREALLKWGLAPGEIAASVAAERIRERWDTVGLELISALDDWAASAEHDSPGLQQESPMAWLREVALAADDDPWRTALRDAMRVTDKNQRRARLEELASSVEVVRQPAVSIVRLVRTLDWLEMFTRAVTLLERAWKNRPGDFWLNHYLGVILLEGKPARLEEAARHLTAAVALRPHTATAHHNLAIVLSRQGKLDAAIAHVERAIELLPGHANAHNTRGLILDAQGKPEESYASFRLAIALGGDSVEVYYLNLGECLKDQGKLDEAATCYREAIALEPGMVQAHLGLCQVLKLRGNLPEALECHGEFLRLHPANANAQASLGNILLEQGKLDEAIAAFERARALEPANFKFHDNLGVALKRRGKFDEAMACYRRAIELQPDVAGTHYNLAIALSDRDSPEEAVSSFREAIRLKPDHVGAHNNLGIALSNLGAIDEAIAAYRKAIDLKPDHVPAHINLGYTLGRQGKQEEAIASCRMAITHAPGAAYPHKHFGAVLQSLGLFADALVELRRAHEIAPENAETSELVAHAERLVELDRKLPSILSGAGPPSDPAESAEFAELCHQKRLFAAAVRLWVTVLAARPDLAGNLQAGHRYNAACAAALAGAGQGKDAGDLDGAARRRLREQARTWLEADLELWRARLESREGTDLAGLQRVLKHWRRDPDLAGIRDAGARQGLEQSEQGELARLWADVATAIERARSLNAEKSARP